MKVYSLPGKLEVTWDADVKAIIDTWSTYSISLEEFKEAVLVKGLNHAKANKGVAWIVDSSKAQGVFSQEIQGFIGSDIFPQFAKNGIKYFITIDPVVPITRLTVSTYKKKLGPNGIQLVEVPNVAEAKKWLKDALSK